MYHFDIFSLRNQIYKLLAAVKIAKDLSMKFVNYLKIGLLVSFFSANAAMAQLAAPAVVPSALAPQANGQVAAPQMKDCIFCGIEVGSKNPPRVITTLSVVGKPAEEGLPSVYAPADLVDIDPELMTPLYRDNIIKSGVSEKLRSSAYVALRAMLDEAHLQRLNLFIHSAYRSYEIQCKVFVTKLEKEIVKSSYDTKKKEDVLNAILQVNTRSAKPGQSEHQLGTVVDLVTYLPKYEVEDKPNSGYALEFEMQDTPEFRWLSENAQRFGFALSYPYSKAIDFNQQNPRTGYIYEPWHWRFIGTRRATEFKKCGALVLREYLKALDLNPNFSCVRTAASK